MMFCLPCRVLYTPATVLGTNATLWLLLPLCYPWENNCDLNNCNCIVMRCAPLRQIHSLTSAIIQGVESQVQLQFSSPLPSPAPIHLSFLGGGGEESGLWKRVIGTHKKVKGKTFKKLLFFSILSLSYILEIFWITRIYIHVHVVLLYFCMRGQTHLRQMNQSNDIESSRRSQSITWPTEIGHSGAMEAGRKTRT